MPGSITAKCSRPMAHIYGDSTCNQNALYDVGMSGIPVINVNNN